MKLIIPAHKTKITLFSLLIYTTMQSMAGTGGQQLSDDQKKTVMDLLSAFLLKANLAKQLT
ncbi:MAG: hypothetical protein ACK5MZ_08995 [Aestuariibaculum sp.]